MAVTDDYADVLNQLYASMSTGDLGLWEDRLGEDAVVIGTDEAEWWQGRDVLLPVMAAQFAEMGAAGIRVERGDPVQLAAGDAVCLVDRPTLVLGDGTRVAARITAVIATTADSWTLVHCHLSVGTPNEDVVQQELTLKA